MVLGFGGPGTVRTLPKPSGWGLGRSYVELPRIRSTGRVALAQVAEFSGEQLFELNAPPNRRRVRTNEPGAVGLRLPD